MEVKAFRKAVMECLIKGEFDGFIGGVLEYQAAVYVKGEYKQRRLFRKKYRKIRRNIGGTLPLYSIRDKKQKPYRFGYGTGTKTITCSFKNNYGSLVCVAKVYGV